MSIACDRLPATWSLTSVCNTSIMLAFIAYFNQITINGARRFADSTLPYTPGLAIVVKKDWHLSLVEAREADSIASGQHKGEQKSCQ